MKDRKDDFVVSDAITDLEQAFPLKDLLVLDYFSRHRDGYYRCREEGWQVPPRNYYNLLQYLREIYDYREEDVRTFAKALRGSAADMWNSDATFAEIIVYRYYIRLAHEGIIKSLRWVCRCSKQHGRTTGRPSSGGRACLGSVQCAEGNAS